MIPLHGTAHPILSFTLPDGAPWAAGYGLQAIEAAKEESSDEEAGEMVWSVLWSRAAGVGNQPRRSADASRCSSRTLPPFPTGKPDGQGNHEEEEEEDGLDPEMAAMMGFGGFGSTKQR